jgi:AmmeMemoRadiSam system protein B/AmmeMemoRadiSam system protein A
MTRLIGRLLLLFFLALGTSGCRAKVGEPAPVEPASVESAPPEERASPTAAARPEVVEQPAVAGLFYPRRADALSAQLAKLLADAGSVPLGRLRGLVCPHAGYEFSGPTAAIGYKQLIGCKFQTVVVLGPSHTTEFHGAAVLDASAYDTPLGPILLSPRAAELAQHPPFCLNPTARVHRPNWAGESSRKAPPPGQETPFTWEHSVEVQLPFLRTVLSDFRLVPVVMGEVDAEQAAQALAPFLDPQTLVVASSDLSHFYPYETAQQLDASCLRAICDLDVKWMAGEDACGKLPILTLMHLARQFGWKTRLLDYRNSGDTAGDRSHVVGYAAVAFFEDAESSAPPAPEPPRATTSEREFLLDLARTAVTQAVKEEPRRELNASQVPEPLRRWGACFVTLTKDQRLRGCIGHIFACRPLYQSVIENATAAALSDPRFPPVTPQELEQLDIEISLLTAPKRLDYSAPEELLDKLQPGRDGVVFALRGRQATYLPQVWKQLPGKEQFLDELARKAGLSARAWKDPTAAMLTYQVEAFHGPYKK